MRYRTSLSRLLPTDPLVLDQPSRESRRHQAKPQQAW